MSLPPCPQCASEYTYEDGRQYICPEYTYEDGRQYICPECAHEWNETESAADLEAEVLDANGAALQNGDTVILIKDLKVKGSSMTIKQGTKVKGIRLQEGDHNIGCKIDGSAMNLKSEFVKKA
ncbi:zinc ribbon domain-containing protein YjdM [Neisseria bergeri]|uniref:zinc ribbon domain-containing protein YjdM n=1 Tax=Neisseria bergeri TaxID=1906581 RepID=UPI000E59249D|nr:zinc ribbon domain-containing protein YjdM [Neisseria bergeri]